MSAPTTTTCPSCGVTLPASGAAPNERYLASAECQFLCGELADDPVFRQDSAFPYQIVVDVYAAQHAAPDGRPIGTAFALIGLYLALERGFTGKAVQQAHSFLAQRSKDWPRFEPPRTRSPVTILDVVRCPPGEARMAMLYTWARAVWGCWTLDRDRIARLVARYLPPESNDTARSPARPGHARVRGH